MAHRADVYKRQVYSSRFNVSLVVLTVLTTLVMTAIGNNVALSLGMVGALSIVRFRTAIKDSRDTIYIFWAVVVGLACGVGDYSTAGAGSAMVFVILLILGQMCIRDRYCDIRACYGTIVRVIYCSFKLDLSVPRQRGIIADHCVHYIVAAVKLQRVRRKFVLINIYVVRKSFPVIPVYIALYNGKVLAEVMAGPSDLFHVGSKAVTLFPL